MKTPIDYSISPDFSTMPTPKLFGATDPLHVFTATQPVNFYRSFITLLNDQEQRKGYLPNVMLDQINDPNNYQLQSNIPKDDYGSFIRLNMLSNGAANGGFVTSDTTGPAYKRSILMGGDPYVKLQPDWISDANLSPNFKAYDLQTQSERDAQDQGFNQFIAEQNFDGTKKNIETSNKKIIRREALDAVAQRMLDWGTAKRLSEDFEAEGGALTWVLSKAAGGYANLEEQVSRIGTDYTYRSMSDLMQEAYGNQQDIARYEVPGLFLSGGQLDDVANYVKYRTPDEIQNGFDPTKWWDNNINPEVISHLANLGVTKDDINGAIGSNEALSIIQFKLAETTISQRLQRYTDDHPFIASTVVSTVANLPTMMFNDPDMAISLGLSTVVTTIKRPLKLAQLTLLATAQRTKNTIPLLFKSIEGIERFASNKYIRGYSQRALSVGEGVLAIGQGDLPQYFKNYNWLAKVGIAGGIGAVANVGQNLTEQRDRIAFASAAMWNSEQDQYHIAEFGFAALMGAGFGAALELNNAATARADEFKTLFKQKKILDAYKTTSLVGVIPQHGASIEQGLDAANTVVTAARAEQPVDILTQTGEQVKDNRVTVTDASGKSYSVTEDDIVSISEISTEDSLNGSYRKVTDSRTNEQVYIHKNTMLTSNGDTVVKADHQAQLPPKPESMDSKTHAEIVSRAYSDMGTQSGRTYTIEERSRAIRENLGDEAANFYDAVTQEIGDTNLKNYEQSKLVKSEEPPLTEGEKHLTETAHVTDTASVVSGANKADGLARTAEDGYMSRADGESDLDYAQRSINGGAVNTMEDLARLVPQPNSTGNKLARLVEYKRAFAAMRQLLLDVKTNKPPEWTANLLNQINLAEQAGVDTQIANIVQGGTKKFEKLTPAQKKLVFEFIKEHSGKSGEEIEALLFTDTALSAYEKNLLRNRLVAQVDSKVVKQNVQKQAKVNKLMGSSANWMSSLDYIQLFIGDRSELSAGDRLKALKAFQNPAWFYDNANQTLVTLYNDVMGAFYKVDSGDNYAEAIRTFGSLLRASLMPLNLVDLKASGRKLTHTVINDRGAAGGTAFWNKETNSLEITMNKDVIVNAFINGDIKSALHVLLHELGHVYGFLATPQQMLRIVQSYTELRNPMVLKFLADMHVQQHPHTFPNPKQNEYGNIYSVVNPAEYFANYFSYSQTSFGISALLADSEANISGNAFVAYIQDVLTGITTSIKKLALPDTILIQKYNKELNRVIKDIGNNKATRWGVDMTVIQDTDQAITNYIVDYMNQNKVLISSRTQYFNFIKDKLIEHVNSISSLSGISLSKLDIILSNINDITLENIHEINVEEIFLGKRDNDGFGNYDMQWLLFEPLVKIMEQYGIYLNRHINLPPNQNPFVPASSSFRKSSLKHALIMLFDPKSIVAVLSSSDRYNFGEVSRSDMSNMAEREFHHGLSSGDIQKLLDTAQVLSTSIAYSLWNTTLNSPKPYNELTQTQKHSKMAEFLKSQEAEYIDNTVAFLSSASLFSTDENYNNINKYFDFIDSMLISINDENDVNIIESKPLSTQIVVQNKYEVPLSSDRNTKVMIPMNRPRFKEDRFGANSPIIFYHMSAFNGLSNPTQLSLSSLPSTVNHIMNNTEGFNRIVIPEGSFFHGSRETIQQLIDFNQKDWHRMIYGAGLYTTDTVNKAMSYADLAKGAVHRIIEKIPIKFFDMEQSVGEALHGDIIEILEAVINPSLQKSHGITVADLLDSTDINKHSSMVEIYDWFREFINQGVSSSEIIDVDMTIRGMLKEKGYGGYRHEGGRLTGTELHMVKIYWEPKSQIDVVPVSVSDVLTPTSYITAHKLILPKDKDGFNILRLPVSRYTQIMSSIQKRGSSEAVGAGKGADSVSATPWRNLNLILASLDELEAGNLLTREQNAYTLLSKVGGKSLSEIQKAGYKLIESLIGLSETVRESSENSPRKRSVNELKERFNTAFESIYEGGNPQYVYSISTFIEDLKKGGDEGASDTNIFTDEHNAIVLSNFFRDAGIDMITFENSMRIEAPFFLDANHKGTLYGETTRSGRGKGYHKDESHIILNPDIVTVVAIGSVENGEFVWRDKSTNEVMPTETVNTYSTEYANISGLVLNSKLLPRPSESISLKSIQIEQGDKQVQPTDITEVTTETESILREQVNKLITELFKNSVFMGKLQRSLVSVSLTKRNTSEAASNALGKLTQIALTELSGKTKRDAVTKENVVIPPKVPRVLQLKTHNDIISYLTGIGRNDGLTDYKKQTVGGLVVSEGSSPDVSLLSTGQAHATIDGTTVDSDYRPNEEVEAGTTIDKLHQRRDQFVSWLDSSNEFSVAERAAIIAAQNIRIENAASIKDQLTSTDPKQRELAAKRMRLQGKKKINKMPEGSGIRIYLLLNPEQADTIAKLQLSVEPIDKAKLKKINDTMGTKATKLEKKALDSFNKLTNKPQTNEQLAHSNTVETITKSKKTVLGLIEEKQKNVANDNKLNDETNSSVVAKETEPKIPAAILKGVGDGDSFISSSWDGTLGLFSLGMLFTNENRASGATKASKYKFTVRSTLDKSKVFRVVRKGKTILHDINNVSEPLLNIAGLDKQRLNKITSVIEATHSPQEAIRLVLKALDLEGYTAIEFVDLTGNLIGHMPTSDKHVKVTEILNHEDMKSDGDPVGYLTPEQIAAKVTEPKVISEVLPETKVNPTEPVIDPIVLPTEVVDGNPVDTGAPIVKGESDIAVITPEEKFAHEVMNAKTALRYNGMTPKIIKIALLKFAQAAKKLRANIGETTTGIPEEFKKLLYTIHQAGEMIAEKNRQQLGDNYDTINNEFWLIYDREVAKDVLNKAVPEEKIPFKTIDDIIKYAHEKVNENIKLRNQRDGTNIPEFLRPLMPNDFIIVSSKVTNTNPDRVLFANDSLAHQMNMIAEKNIKAANKAKPNTVEKVELMSEDAVADAVIAAINESPHDNTMLLREGNWVGLIFGGSQREARNWWKRSMTNVSALIDHGSGYGSTVKNLSNIVRTISAFASIDKVHLHHLTASKRNAFKTWEASSSEVYRMTSGIRQSSILLAKKTNEKLYVLLTKEIMVSMLSKKAFNKTNVETIIKSLIPDASQKFMDVATKHSVDLYNGVIGINKRMLGLENQTGWLSLLDSSGKPLNPAEYFPVTFVGEKVTQANYTEVVGALVEVRKQTLNEQKTLDTLVMLSLGWLYNKSGNILHKGREVVGRAQHQIDDANFDKQTLINLEERRYEAGTDVTKLIEMNGQASKRHFTYIDPLTGDVVVCRIPALKTDLSMLDLAKYTQVVNGSTSYLNKMWEQSSFKGLNPVNVMMMDLLDAKLYRGEYHPVNGPRGKNPSFPMTMLNDSSGYEFASATPSLTNEEVLRSPILIDILRADPLEAYRNFTKNRGFELLVQHEIDRMIGIKGVRMHRFMEILLKEAKRHATNLRGEAGAKEVQDGFNRLSEEYLKHQGRLGAVVASSYGQFKNELTTVGLNVVRAGAGLIWGVMSATEPLIQLAVSPFTVGPTQSAKNLFETVRFLIGDKRFSMTQLYKDDIKESIFFMDMIRQDLHDGILTTPIDGVPRMTTWFDRIKASRDDRSGRFPYLSATTEVIANIALEVGSSKYTTVLGKKFAMQRYAKTFATYINSGAALKLANALAKNPKLETLRAEAMTSSKAAAAQKKLFITLARESGFGGRWEIAMAMNQYGLIQVDRIAALQAAFKKLGPQYSKNGLVNFTELRELFHTNLNKSVLAGVEGQVGSDSFEALMNACELMTTTKGMISNPRGLNSETSLQSRTPMGRMMKSLLGWSRSFYNNVIGNYGGQRESAYLGSLIMYAAITAVTDMLKEWINGRDVSDMVKEMRDNPSVILFRILHNLPIAGQFTNSVQGTLEKINELSGGAKAKQRGSSWFPAIDMAEQYTKDLPKAASHLIQESFPNGDVPNIAKDIGTIGFNNYFNGSPLAIAPRLLQEMGIINETSAFGKYMNLIKKRKNSYSAIPDLGSIPEESKASRERKQQLLKELDTILRK